MPTRFIDPNILTRAFDALVPPGNTPKESIRWKELSREVGLGEHWIRKRYHGVVRAELDVRSIELIRKALERKSREAKDPSLRPLIEHLSATDTRPVAVRLIPPESHANADPFKMRVVKVAFIRGSNASYAMRVEAGIRSGMVAGLRATHLVDDESLDLSGALHAGTESNAIKALVDRFSENRNNIDRTYLVALGTPATNALVALLKRDTPFRRRLGRDFRIIFAALVNPDKTGILEFDRDYVGGMSYGLTAVERVRFIQEAFPGRPITYLHDPDLLPDTFVLEELLEHPELEVRPVKVRKQHQTVIPPQARDHLVMGLYFLNLHIHELVRDNPQTPFIGINTTDLSRGAVLSTGNDDFQAGIECAHRLIIPDCCNEINLRDTEVLKPQPVYGLNQRACNAHGLVPKIVARNKCKVVLD